RHELLLQVDEEQHRVVGGKSHPSTLRQPEPRVEVGAFRASCCYQRGGIIVGSLGPKSESKYPQ
ncbi:MAG TPA: hypothetical protein VGI66_19630, partial [Streptosporangiaceae bacterium]